MTLKKSTIIAFLLLLPVASWCRIDSEEIKEMDQSVEVPRIGNDDIRIEMPHYALKNSYIEIHVKFVSPTHPKLVLNNNKLEFIINGKNESLTFDEKGEAVVPVKFDKENEVRIFIEDFGYGAKVTVISLWLLVLPVVLIFFWVLKRAFFRK